MKQGILIALVAALVQQHVVAYPALRNGYSYHTRKLMGSYGSYGSYGEDSASCVATLDTSAVSLSTDVILNSVANAVASVCHSDTDAMVVTETSIKGAAVAFAQATASVQLECVSQGFGFECQTATASAEAWAIANAQAFASGFAKVIMGCGTCKGSEVAIAEAAAATLVDLTAEATAVAEVTACVAGNQAASGQAWVSCYAESFGRLMTQAIAIAMVNADCVTSSMQAFVSAATQADFTQTATCAFSTSTQGNAQATVTGTATAVCINAFISNGESPDVYPNLTCCG